MSRIGFAAITICLLVHCELAGGAEGILQGAADPAIIAAPRGDSGYYVYATGAGLPIWKSEDLVHWQRVGRVFDSTVPAWAAEAVPGTKGFWAPDIAYFNGRYHLYYSVSTFGGQRSVIGLATNTVLNPDDPKYHWEDQGMVIESIPGKDEFNAIDSALFVDRDGKTYLIWGSYWTGIKMTEVDPKTGKPAPGELEVQPLAGRAGNASDIEGAYLVLHGGLYYLFVSWGSCCDGAESTYRVMAGRATAIRGPYLDFQGKPMLEGGGTLVLAGNGRWRGTGHNSVLQTEHGDYMAHHTYDTEHLEARRILQIRPLYWGADGWPAVGEPLMDGAAAAPREIPAEGIAGAWRHSVDYNDSAAREIRLLPNGRIGTPDSPNTWTLDGDTLTMLRPSGAAPGGAWRGVVKVEPGGNSYIGRNQLGQVIRGVRE